MSTLWKSWAQVRNETRERTVYLYGRSEDWVHKAVSGFGGKISGIVDRETSYHGMTYYDLIISPIEKIGYRKDVYFIITSGDFGGIIDELESLGYRSGMDFSCSPDFQDYEALGRLKRFDKKILISSSDYNDRKRARSSWLGGGFILLIHSQENLKKKQMDHFASLRSLRMEELLPLNTLIRNL